MKPLARIEAGWRRPTLLAYLRCIRYQDVLVLQGPPLFGALFALDHLTLEALPRLTVFLVASVLLVAHVFGLNDWAGVAADRNDPNKAASVFLNQGLRPRAVGTLSVVLLVVSLSLFATLRGSTLLLAGAIAALGAVYSHPAVDAKGTPLVASVPHLVGGILHFLLGYSLFGTLDGRGVLIALYFALTFTAGHLNQEVRDYDGDRANGIRTSAVQFGRARVFLASWLVFTLAYAQLGFLVGRGLVPRALGLVLLLYPVHAFWSFHTLRAGLTFTSVSWLQARYRVLYGLIGLLMLGTLVLR